MFLAFVMVFVAGNALAASFRENGGAVVIEAEHYDNLRPSQDGGNVSWGLRTDTANYLEGPTSNSEYLYVGANSINGNYTPFSQTVLNNAPRADYNVEFTTGGTYYIWVLANENPGNSLYLVADFQLTAAAVQGNGNWVWWNDDRFLTPAAQVTLTTGVHTISIYQREANCGVDKIILTLNAGFVPTGFGPEETGSSTAHTPVPANGNVQVNSTAVTSVSWYSPLQDETGAVVGAPDIVSVNGYTVWFGTAVPNELTDTPTFTTSQSLPVSLGYETTYYWRVDTHVTRTGNITDVIEGQVWQFTTLPVPPPNLSVYPPVPGLAPSEFYSFRVREVNSSQWLSPFACITRCVDKATAEATHYFEHLADWSNTYCNFEMANNVPVEVEITRLNPSTGTPVAIQKAVAHPRRKVRSWRVENGKAYVIIDKPVLFAVDIDGQMDEQNTGKGYSGPPIHTVTVFANPFITDKPNPAGSGVYAVNPGEIPPDTGTWSTLYFKPGVHDIGKSFRVHKSKSYYIPGEAIVYGTFNNDKDSSDGSNIRIFGHGTLSGARIPHPDDDPEILDSYHYKPIDISGASNTRVEGITIADSANHSLMLIQGYSPSTPTDIRWVKIFTWRGNGDGINPFGNGVIEDCFLRTQDDSCYVNGRGIRRTVYWNDYNGSAFVLSPVGNISNPNLVVEDCDVIYMRAGWDKWAGGRVFNMRAEGSGAGGSNVTFRNINVEDPRPTLQQYLMMTEGLPPYRDPNEKNGPGDIFGIRFQNITIAAPSVLGLRDTFWGYSEAQYRNLVFNNLTVAGQHYDSINDFVYNQYVHDFVFENTAPETMTYLNTSGYGKWYVYGDWNGGVEPANNDIVNHTAVAAVLTVDAPAYAGTLNIAHADTATVSIKLGGKLNVTNTVSLGATGSGKLDLLDGALKLQSSLSSALSVTNGNIHIEKGTLQWAGNNVSAIQSLYTAGHITFANGRAGMLANPATLIGQNGLSKLYANYNNAAPGYTTVWATDSTDLSGDGKVNLKDFSILSAGWQSSYDMSDLVKIAEDWLTN